MLAGGVQWGVARYDTYPLFVKHIAPTMHEIILDTEKNNVLVAYLPSPKDLALALGQDWYRIPVAHAISMA